MKKESASARKEFINTINLEKELYFKHCSGLQLVCQAVLWKRRYTNWRVLYYFRYYQRYADLLKTQDNLIQCIFLKCKKLYYARKMNVYSHRANIQISSDSKLGSGIMFCHGGIVINGVVGKNCVFHGNNIIGNKGIGREKERPFIGDNVDIGAGAVIIGNVRIADHCCIGANAVVVKDVSTSNSIAVGNPARIIYREETE